MKYLGIDYGEKKVGIAIKPSTRLSKIKKYLPLLDEVLILTVHPGKYGAKFHPKSLEKVKQLRRLMPKMDIEVDGGINDKHIILAEKAGANLFVSGSYLQKNPKGIYKLRGKK